MRSSVMETKYVYRFWRPETAIHSGDADGNIFTRGDASFAPLIVAPCFPGYGSAHASAAGAAREVLESLYESASTSSSSRMPRCRTSRFSTIPSGRSPRTSTTRASSAESISDSISKPGRGWGARSAGMCAVRNSAPVLNKTMPGELPFPAASRRQFDA